MRRVYRLLRAGRSGSRRDGRDSRWRRSSARQLPITVPGAALPPTDPNFDGAFRNVNGNRRRDFADVVSLFNNLDWIAASEPVVRFDFNHDQRIDFADVVLLFNTT